MKNTFWVPKAEYEGNAVYLTHHLSRTLNECKSSIMMAAVREGFIGDVEERLKELGWVITEVSFCEVGNT